MYDNAYQSIAPIFNTVVLMRGHGNVQPVFTTSHWPDCCFRFQYHWLHVWIKITKYSEIL